MSSDPPLSPSELFRSSRPDFIETGWGWSTILVMANCSGLPGRTSLRPRRRAPTNTTTPQHCSGLPGRTSLRLRARRRGRKRSDGLFRSSRPDFIETFGLSCRVVGAVGELFRSSRPDFIETANRSNSRSVHEYCSGLPSRTSLRRHW